LQNPIFYRKYRYLWQIKLTTHYIFFISILNFIQMKKHLFFPLFAFMLFPFLLHSQSLQDQLNNAQPGDTIAFSGTQIGNFSTSVHGTASNPIVIRGLGTDAVIDGNGTGSGYGLKVLHNYYRLENFTIQNCKKGLYIENADHGKAKNIHIADIGQEAFKVKRNSNYWLFEGCSTLNTGLSGDYGEGFYVGDASGNWAVSTEPDTPGYVTFLNCTAIDPINDGFDFKEGAHHIKAINCKVEWINVTPLSTHGNSGYYSRADDLQYINCSSKGNDSGGPAFKHFQTDVNGVRYGYRVELKEMLVQDHSGDAIHFHRNDIAETSVLYDDYTLLNVAGNLWSSTAEAPIIAASEFTEMTWDGEGGAVYGSSDPVAVTGVEVTPSSLSLSVGQTASLTATVSPENATNKEVSWSSDNEAVATVDADGVVTAVAEGSATIMATTSDGGFTDYSAVTVSETADTGSDCNFGTPSAEALPSITQEYVFAHVIGSGPALSNFKEFSIKWKLPSNGLYKFAINTTDGDPDYYVDLRGNTTHNFSSPEPAFTLSGSGLEGLDGEYWIAIHEGNIVWEEKSGSYTIYFSNSATPPSCTSTTSMNSENTITDFKFPSEEDMRLYPNPVEDFLTIRHDELEKGDVIEVYSLTGTLMHHEIVVNKQSQRINLEGIDAGMYILKVKGAKEQVMRIVKQ
jgi:hypothetical protein